MFVFGILYFVFSIFDFVSLTFDLYFERDFLYILEVDFNRYGLGHLCLESYTASFLSR